MISIFSVFAGVLWLNLAMLLVMVLQKCASFRIYYSSAFLALVAILALLRILMPLDLQYAYVINSYNFLRGVQRFLAYPIWSWTVGQSLLVVWGIGSLVSLLREGFHLWQEAGQLRRIRPVRSAQVERIAAQLHFPVRRVIVSPDVETPYSGGFFFPKAYIPSQTLPDSDIRWILRHEQQHIKGRDACLKLFYLILKILFWWNPVSHIFRGKLESLLENRCDQRLVAHCPLEEKLSYTSALIRTARLTCGRKPAHPVGVASFVRPDAEDELTQRINLILNGKPRRKSVTILMTALCVAVFIASYFVIVQPAYEVPDDELTEEIVVTSDNAYLVRTVDGTYDLWIGDMFGGSYNKEDLRSEPLHSLNIYEEKAEER